MEVSYQGRVVGSIGKMGSNTYIFTIKTKIMHRTIEYKAKNLKEAEKKAKEYLEYLINQTHSIF